MMPRQQYQREEQQGQQPQHRGQQHHRGPPQHHEAPRQNPSGGVSEDMGAPLGSPSQCLLNAGTLALFAHSTRTPPPRSPAVNPKSEWRAGPSVPPEETAVTFARARRMRDASNKPEAAPQETQQQGATARHVLVATHRCERDSTPQAHARPQQYHQPEGQREAPPTPESRGAQREPSYALARRASPTSANVCMPDITVSPPSAIPVTSGPPLQQRQQHQRQYQRSTRRHQVQQLSCRGLETAAHGRQPGPFGDLSPRAVAAHPSQWSSEGDTEGAHSRGPRGPSARARKGRKRRDRCIRRDPACRRRLSGSPGGLSGSPEPPTPEPGNACAAGDGVGVLTSCGGTPKPFHAEHLLDLSPLLLAKILQLLPAPTAAIFGSTCWGARRVLLSYCCIVSLSARNVSSLLSLPSAALRRQVPFLSGLKNLEIDLASSVSPPLFLGGAAAAAAAPAAPAGRLRSPEAGDERGTEDSSSREQQAHTPRGARGDRRPPQQQQRSGSSSRHPVPQQQQEGERGTAVATPPEGTLEHTTVSRLSWAYGLVQGRALDVLRLQPTLLDSAADDGGPAAAGSAHSAAGPWTTFAAASASLLLSSFRHLKSVSARLKLSLTGAPGEAQAATELLLLLQLLLHTNAHSLVSIRIAVDLPPSSVSLLSKGARPLRAALSLQQHK